MKRDNYYIRGLLFEAEESNDPFIVLHDLPMLVSSGNPIKERLDAH